MCPTREQLLLRFKLDLLVFFSRVSVYYKNVEGRSCTPRFTAMPMSPYSYPSYYSPPPHYSPPPPHHFSSSYSDPMPYAHQEISLSHQDHLMSHSMQPPPSPSIPIDPALSLYPPYYHSYPPQNQQHVPPHLSLPHNYSSPSSQGSDTIGTPPMYPSSANSNGKRPGSAVSNGTSKKARKDDDDEPQSPSADREEGKAKPTRGSRYLAQFVVPVILTDFFPLAHALYVVALK